MTAVQQRWAIVAARVGSVRSLYNEVLIRIRREASQLLASNAAEIRKAVAYLEVRRLHALHRVSDVLHEFHLERVVDGAPDGLQELRCRLSQVHNQTQRWFG